MHAMLFEHMVPVHLQLISSLTLCCKAQNVEVTASNAHWDDRVSDDLASRIVTAFNRDADDLALNM